MFRNLDLTRICIKGNFHKVFYQGVYVKYDVRCLLFATMGHSLLSSINLWLSANRHNLMFILGIKAPFLS